MIPGIFNTPVTVKRRVSTGRDSLNNPTYGNPTSGSGWSTVYASMPARLAFSSKAIQFATMAERPTPNGVCYYGPDYTVLSEDRILTTDGIEYVVTSVVPGYINNTVVDHYEALLALP
jgi:hypothetical protein